MLDGLLLLGDDPLHQVADRDDPHYVLVFNDRKMSYAMVRHDGHALVQSVLWRHEIHRTRQDLYAPGFLGRPSFEDDFARVVPLRDYAYQFARRDDQQRSDSRFGHPFDGLIDRLFRLHRPEFFPLVFQDRADTVTESQHWRRTSLKYRLYRRHLAGLPIPSGLFENEAMVAPCRRYVNEGQ